MDITTRPESSKVALPGRRFPAVELASAKPVAANGASQTSSTTDKNKENNNSENGTSAAANTNNNKDAKELATSATHVAFDSLPLTTTFNGFSQHSLRIQHRPPPEKNNKTFLFKSATLLA